MNRAALSLLVLAGLASSVHGQALLKAQVSRDGGATWSNSVDVFSGDHVEVLFTASYTGTSTAISGFGEANFQPIVSNWDAAGTGTNVDRLLPISQGGNVLGSMVNAQSSSAGVGSPNPYLVPTPGTSGAPVPAAPYGAGTYGRVYPVGRTYLNGANALTGFVHVNPPPDPLGRTYASGTYLRIAQAVVPDWFNVATNLSGGSGVNCAQLFVVGRTTSDPDYWGNRDTVYDPGDPANGIPASYSQVPNGHNERRQNVQLFRFGFDLSDDPDSRVMLVDAPEAGQIFTPGFGRWIGFFSNDPSHPTADARLLFGAQASIESATIRVNIPSPVSVAVLGIGLAWGCRRRAGGRNAPLGPN